MYDRVSFHPALHENNEEHLKLSSILQRLLLLLLLGCLLTWPSVRQLFMSFAPPLHWLAGCVIKIKRDKSKVKTNVLVALLNLRESSHRTSKKYGHYNVEQRATGWERTDGRNIRRKRRRQQEEWKKPRNDRERRQRRRFLSSKDNNSAGLIEDENDNAGCLTASGPNEYETIPSQADQYAQKSSSAAEITELDGRLVRVRCLN